MIQAASIKKAYGPQVLFDDAGFTLGKGERVGLVGRNGHGKTTLFRLILGLEQPDSGIISIPDGYRIGHLSQNISFSRDTVLEEACLGLQQKALEREKYRAESILMGLGFNEEEFRASPYAISGGFQVRLNIAKTLLQEPDLLLLDEPTNYLDILSIRWLTKFLRSWKNELILITHDREFMDSVTTHTMGIHRQKIRKITGGTEKYYRRILEEEELYEKTRQNEEKRRKEIERFITRFRAKATKASAVQSRIKMLEKRGKKEELNDIESLDFRFNSIAFKGKALIEAKGISFSFGEFLPHLISDFSISIGKRDRIAVIGRNGKGKTTLLNLIAGNLEAKNGEIKRHADLKMALFGQTNIERLDPGKTVEAEIMESQKEYNYRSARAICGLMMFEGNDALKKVSVLSGGEKSRVLLGKLLVSPANLLLLDEPTNHLDMESVESLLWAMEEFEGAIVIVTHSEMILNTLAQRLVVFEEGKVRTFEGGYQDFLERSGWKEEQDLRPDRTEASKNEKNEPGRKELRRIRAELITSRGQVLGSLQRSIQATEEEITHLEDELRKSTEALLEASRKGDGEAVKKSSKTFHDAKLRIELLFSELERLTLEHEQKTRDFEEKLSAVGGLVPDIEMKRHKDLSQGE